MKYKKCVEFIFQKNTLKLIQLDIKIVNISNLNFFFHG